MAVQKWRIVYIGCGRGHDIGLGGNWLGGAEDGVWCEDVAVEIGVHGSRLSVLAVVVKGFLNYNGSV